MICICPMGDTALIRVLLNTILALLDALAACRSNTACVNSRDAMQMLCVAVLEGLRWAAELRDLL